MALLLLPYVYFAVALMNIYRRHRLQQHGLDPDLITAKAQQRVDIAVPYFYPGRSFRRALRGAARRGVQVRPVPSWAVTMYSAAAVRSMIMPPSSQAG